MDAFSKAAVRQYQRRVAEYLRTHYGQVPVHFGSETVTVSRLPESTLELFVSFGMDRAQKYGIRHQAGVAAFIALAFLAGPTFDENPVVKAELIREDVPDRGRMDHVCAVIPRSVWAKTRAGYVAAAWPRNCTI